MAARKPLVLVGGEIAQLPAGDTLTGPFGEVDTMTLTNGDAGAHALGDIVYISAADTGKKAKADAVGTKDAIAVAMGAITAGTTGSYQSDGLLAGLAGLTPGAVYYLSAATAGLMTTTAPSAAGQFVTRIGIAVSATELDINIQRAIAL
jgi:hypothetical protein